MFGLKKLKETVARLESNLGQGIVAGRYVLFLDQYAECHGCGCLICREDKHKVTEKEEYDPALQYGSYQYLHQAGVYIRTNSPCTDCQNYTAKTTHTRDVTRYYCKRCRPQEE